MNIKGICVNHNDIKISQYADDTTLILDGSEEQALLSALSMLDEFSKASGLKLNEKKTEALWIGSSIGNDKLSLPGKEIKWPESKVKTLGLWLSVEPEIAVLLNYDGKVEKIRKILSCWKYRRLTLLGRITVLKLVADSVFAIFFAIELQCFESDQQAVLSVSLERKGRQNQTQNYDK